MSTWLIYKYQFNYISSINQQLIKKRSYYLCVNTHKAIQVSTTNNYTTTKISTTKAYVLALIKLLK